METGETLFFISCDMRELGCEKKRQILEISQKCYFFIHFPILELVSRSPVHQEKARAWGRTVRPLRCRQDEKGGAVRGRRAHKARPRPRLPNWNPFGVATATGTKGMQGAWGDPALRGPVRAPEPPGFAAPFSPRNCYILFVSAAS